MFLPNDIISLILTYRASYEICSSLNENIVIVAAKMLILCNITYKEALYILTKPWKRNLVDSVHHGVLPIFRFLFSTTNPSKEEITEALLLSAHKGRGEILRFLIDKGIPLSSELLSEACWKGHFPIVKLLLDSAVEIDEKSLVNASYRGHLSIVKLLVDSGVPLDIRKTAIYWSYKQPNQEIRKYLGRGIFFDPKHLGGNTRLGSKYSSKKIFYH